MTKARDIASAAPAPSTVSATELGYLDGVTSAIQTQLNQKPEFVAGKNKIINGDFNIWQRGTSFTPAAGNALVYTADRFFSQRNGTGATVTVSQQTFTPGTAPVSGYESSFFGRYAQTVAGSGGTYAIAFGQNIEDVRTFAGQTITISFWAKADSAREVTVGFNQIFGSGGSSSVNVAAGDRTLSTSWARYSSTVTIPSISGKTIGTSSHLQFYFSPITVNQIQTFDIWGLQIEAGSVATPFQTATGTVQGELAACQRYYYRSTTDGVAGYANFATSRGAKSTTQVEIPFPVPVQMRIVPNIFDYLNITLDPTVAIGTPLITNAIATLVNVQFTTTGLTQFRPYTIIGNNSATAYVAFSAEF